MMSDSSKVLDPVVTHLHYVASRQCAKVQYGYNAFVENFPMTVFIYSRLKAEREHKDILKLWPENEMKHPKVARRILVL